MPDWSQAEFVTVADVADLLKLNQQTIRNWIDAGTLPALRLGRRVRILRSDLDQLVEQSYTCSAAPAQPLALEARAFWDGTLVQEASSAR